MTAPRFASLLGAAALLTALLGTPACAFQLGDGPADRGAAEAALLAGRYDDAIAVYRRLADDAARPAAERARDRRALLRTLALVGRYDEAATLGQPWLADSGGVTVATALGEALYRRGRVAEAERLFRQAAAGGAPDSLTARLRLAVLRLERGEHDAALRELDAFIDVYNAHRAQLTSEELAAVAEAVRHLGRRDPQLFKDALAAYDEAIAADSANQAARVRLGDMFAEKYDPAQALGMLEPLLAVNPRHPDALVVKARVLHAAGQPGVAELVQQALAVNPHHVEAHVVQALLHLDVEDHARAQASAEQALATDPGHIEALAVLGAAHYLRGDRAGYEAARQRAAARNPKHAGFFVVLAEQSARNRLYADAAAFAQRGVELDSTTSRALALLGINQMRTGAVADGRRALDAAFARDPYDTWTYNTLDLLDDTKDYRTVTTPRLQLVLDPRESDLLALYATELGHEAYDSLAARYGWRPGGPVRIEFYPDHADFSVRTVGLAGLGALGVSFGTVLAMDSPAARDAGSFNWGSTLWHELAHTFTLGASGHRVPRWLSEGISVYEERRARPGWGADATPQFLAAYEGGALHPVSRLNDGFMRPAYPQQVMFSYYQASLVAELIEREHGADALPRMLRAYGEGLTTPQVFQRVLSLTPEAFDGRFDAYLRTRFARQLEAVAAVRAPQAGAEGERGGRAAAGDRAPALGGEYVETLRRGVEALEAGRDDEALRDLERVKALFPGVGGPDSPHWHLARLHERRGDLRRAADELLALTAVDEDAHDANVKLAGLLEQLGDTAGAVAALERSFWASPYDVALHERAAAHHAALGQRPQAVRERRAVLALAPVDEAEARYQLALALHQAGDAAEARREVLRALEIAPAFERAQALLLTLRDARPPGGPR